VLFVLRGTSGRPPNLSHACTHVNTLHVSIHASNVRLAMQHDRLAVAEAASLRRCAARLRHTADAAAAAPQSAVGWNHARLPRLIVDYLMRGGHFDSARLLSQQANCDDLCEWHVFEAAQGIVRALRRHDCSAALAWCASRCGLRGMDHCAAAVPGRAQPTRWWHTRRCGDPCMLGICNT
jgi:hypothetical protein